MNHTIQLVLAVISILLTAPLRAQFQLVHDAPNTATTPQLTPVILADGNLVTHQWNSGQHLFRKYDQTGMLIWSRVLTGDAHNTWYGDRAVALRSDGDDGFIFAVHDRMQAFSGGMPFSQDTLVYAYQIARINGSGDLTSSVQLEKRFISMWTNFGYPLKGFDVLHTPDNGLLAIISSGWAPGGSVDMIKIGANWSLEWCRSVGVPIGLETGPVPTMIADPEALAKVAVSSTGRINFAEVSTGPYSHLRLGALDLDGSMLWMKRYVYGNTSPMVQYHDIAVDGNGDVHGAGSLVSNVGRFHILLRTSTDGILERGDIYRTPLALTSGRFGLDGHGRRYHLVSVLDIATGSGSHGMLIADTLGTPALFVRRDDEVILPNNVFTIPQRFDVVGEQLAISNLLHHEDVDLAYTTRYEGLSMFTTDDIAPCLMDDTTLTHIPVPLDPVMTTEEVMDVVSLDVSAYYNVELTSLTLNVPEAEAVSPLCELADQLLGLSTNTYSGSIANTSTLIRNSLVPQGTPILLNQDAVDRVEVYSSNGVLMQLSRLNNSHGVSTSALSPGMYFIRTIDKHGHLTGVGRFVLE